MPLCCISEAKEVEFRAAILGCQLATSYGISTFVMESNCSQMFKVLRHHEIDKSHKSQLSDMFYNLVLNLFFFLFV